MTTQQKKLFDSLARLDEGIMRLQEYKDSDVYDAFGESVIKRFEFSYEMFWKRLKEYQSQKYGSIIRSPRDTFRDAFEKNELTESEYTSLLEMIDDRNNTAHTYEEGVATEIIGKTPTHYNVMTTISRRLFKGDTPL
jgi:nucleotidyltransferase substrate binding protein (TIGR01987 family)